MSSQPQQQPSKGPYRPAIWALGGQPSVSVDVPIQSVFLALFIGSAVTHMTIFQMNKRRGHKFLMSGLLFGFSMARIAASVLRIASINVPQNISLLLAANVFVAAGVVIIFIVNLIFAQRIIRAQHPNSGWHPLLRIVFMFLYGLVIVTIIMVITVTIQTYFTLNPSIRKTDRAIQLYGVTTFAILSFLPIPIVIAGLLIPRKQRVDKFGSGRFRTKIIILLVSSALVCFGASYRAATSWHTPVPRTQPMPSSMSKAAFYIANFGVEVIVVYLYAILRVDLRFHVPDGAKGPGSYSVGAKEKNVRDSDGELERPRSRIYTEEETFDDEEWDEGRAKGKDLEGGSEPSSPQSSSHPR